MARVIVIGAGLSGLSAARLLLEKGIKDVLVLEARDTIGGRMRRADITSPDGKLAVVDLGGQWVGPTQNAILALARDLGIGTFEQFTQGYNTIYYDGTLYPEVVIEPPAPTPEDRDATAALENALDDAAKGIDTEKPWESPDAKTLDRGTLGQWIDSVGEFSAYARFYVGLDATFNQSGGTPDEVSLLNALFERKANPPDQEPDKYLLYGGAGKIPGAMVEKYAIQCRTSSRVVAISQASGKVRVAIAGNPTPEEADAAIVAMPPSLTAAIYYDPSPTARRIQLASRMAMGTIAKVALVYSEPWWRARKLSGMSISSSGTVRSTTDSGEVITGAPGILTSFIQGDQLIQWSALSAEARVQAVKTDLRTYFGNDVDQPSTYSEMIWPGEQFTGGAYNGYLPPGGWTSYGQAIREPLGRVFWAGTETATGWFGYFDGAITAGYRAAEEALTVI